MRGCPSWRRQRLKLSLWREVLVAVKSSMNLMRYGESSLLLGSGGANVRLFSPYIGINSLEFRVPAVSDELYIVASIVCR